uniref:F-box domain-containing protein n=1 Tax=Solanum lycopersicum TaxID=4081 RepID=A0A3Q7F852_SOLLC
MNEGAGIWCPVFNSGDREEDNDGFEAIFEAMNITNVVGGDFVMSILLALPVKSLLRFQSVCWSWHDLILSRRFINIHHHRTNRSSSLICFHSDDSGRTTYNSVSV